MNRECLGRVEMMLECSFALAYSSPNPVAFHECVFMLMSPKGRKSERSKDFFWLVGWPTSFLLGLKPAARLAYNVLMFIKMMMAATINGKITKGDDPIPAHWTSPEDHYRFQRAVQTAELLIIGRGTYDVGPDYFARLPVKVAIMSRSATPAEAKKLPPNVRFFNKTPEQMVELIKKSKLSRILVAGGSVVNRDFLKAGLVDEILLTLEPHVFGSGKPLVAEGDFTSQFRLENVQWANPNGTLFLSYKKVG